MITGQADLGRGPGGTSPAGNLPTTQGGLGEAPACEPLSTGLGCACDFDI